MTTPLCTLQNLTLSYPHKQIFNNITFTLNEFDRIGLLGLNGHGKSSLFKVMMGYQTADTTVPSFLFDRVRDLTLFYVPQELPNLNEQTITNYFYEFYPSFKEIKDQLDQIGEQISSNPTHYEQLLHQQEQLYSQLEREGEPLYHSQFLSYLKTLGVEDTDRVVNKLSGGEQRKLALALGLSCPHKVVLWDEPTNHLDLETIQFFENELQQSRKTFMIISHDRSLLNNVVDRILHIQNGKLKNFQGTYHDYLLFLQEESLRQAKEIDRLNNKQRRETAWISRGVRARRTKSKKRIEDYSLLNQMIQDLKNQSHKSVSLNLLHSGRKTKQLIQADRLSLSFGNQTLFKGLQFTINKGDKIALMGSNGVGKSSLLKLLIGELEASAGTIKLAEQITIGHFSQKRDNLPPHKTPWELIGEGSDLVVSNTGLARHVVGYLEGFLFDADSIKRPISTFSGGEKNRLQLAQFMKNSSDLWIFDEPTNDLDLETIGILEEELNQYEGALIIVGHDRAFIENVTHKCWLLHDQGLEIFEGGWSQAELFLEALELEKELKNKTPPSTTRTGRESNKLTYKEQTRLKKVVSEIEVYEKKVSDLENQLSKFDYTQKESAQKSLQLQQDLTVIQNELDNLLAEWMELEEKTK